MKSYTHKFSNGAICTVVVEDSRPENGSSHIRSLKWSGEQDANIADEYTEFQHIVNQDFADAHGIRIMCITTRSDGEFEKWGYVPHEKHRRL